MRLYFILRALKTALVPPNLGWGSSPQVEVSHKMKTSFGACSAVVGFALLSPHANAQTSDTETEQLGFNFYGQLNRGILWYDDGADDDVYPFVDNSKSVSRLGLTYDQSLDNGWHFQARGEIGLNWKETNNINQLDPNDSHYDFWDEGIRKLEVSWAHPEYGTFLVGQGAMASDGITGQDLSLTTVVAGTAVKDMAGGLLLRRADTGQLSNVRILDRFPTLGSSRRLRLRYDSPVSQNWSFAMAVGKEVLNSNDGRYYADAAARYDATKGDYRVKFGAAVQWAGGNPETTFRNDDVTLAVSGSVLHRPSRYSLSGTLGLRPESGGYIYAKFGRRYYDLFSAGWTAFSIDHYYAREVVGRGDVSHSTGFAVVQQLKQQNSHLYLAVRTYDAKDELASYLRSWAVLTGIRWEF